MTHLLIVGIVALFAFACGTILGLCLIAKASDQAMQRALDEYVDEKIKLGVQAKRNIKV
jgi:hypothetical protein